MPKFKMWTFIPERDIFLYKELCHSVKIYFEKFQSSYLQPMTSQKKIRFLFVIKFTTENILVQTACLNVTTYCIHSLAQSISWLNLPLVLRRMFKNLLLYMVCSIQTVPAVPSNRWIVTCSDPSLLLESMPAQASACLNPEIRYRKENHTFKAGG